VHEQAGKRDFGRRAYAEAQGYAFPLLSDFWPHGAVAQAYGVFNDDAGFSNRGTFVVDRSGIIRFAEMNGPGEPRDQSMWTEALAAVKSG
jgi:peroxiredoxin (alkyl hydroperoxide reductase subunit C)